MKPAPSTARAFTLIEIMVVVAILGIALLIGIPSIREATHREALPQAIRDITEACSRARARAIMHGATVEMRVFPKEGRIEVGDAPAVEDKTTDSGYAQPELGKSSAVPVPTAAHDIDKFPGFSAHLADTITIVMLDVNFTEYKDADEAVIRFHANGTSDEMTLIFDSDRGERRKISLEVVTALADVESLR